VPVPEGREVESESSVLRVGAFIHRLLQ
jgi:hypothetical protein